MIGIFGPLALLGGMVFWGTLGAVAGLFWAFTTFPQPAWGPWWWVACALTVILTIAVGWWLLRSILRWTTRV